MIFLAQVSYGQTQELDMDLEVSDNDKIILFSGFAIAVIGLFLFLARDIILRRKTSYDKEELESKKDKTQEKYHSDWGDDYEEIGKRRNTVKDKEFRDAAKNNELPNYYETLEVSREATQEEIKTKFRELAKKNHPDRTKKDSEETMAKLNKAYEVLSDKESRERYDKYFVD
ncbi:heat shock protein DnaJ domain-containing protein [Candidatus Nitrosopumilus koreensis AR1]|uniref:Heat shock protein DnaJ domain-containing protein n=2 Tax=Nitrosopumilaceae TaxID=338190 RepID=K0B5B3_9ARCH|nr:heat shock protein DnaJ domain-containing protein [Candidatus Nitrosopumilus koreensis AR1]